MYVCIYPILMPLQGHINYYSSGCVGWWLVGCSPQDTNSVCSSSYILLLIKLVWARFQCFCIPFGTDSLSELFMAEKRKCTWRSNFMLQPYLAFLVCRLVTLRIMLQKHIQRFFMLRPSKMLVCCEFRFWGHPRWEKSIREPWSAFAHANLCSKRIISHFGVSSHPKLCSKGI